MGSHVVAVNYGPVAVTAACSCGWTYRAGPLRTGGPAGDERLHFVIEHAREHIHAERSIELGTGEGEPSAVVLVTDRPVSRRDLRRVRRVVRETLPALPGDVRTAYQHLCRIGPATGPVGDHVAHAREALARVLNGEAES